ncbi:hypothetical protein HanPI659440_Chr03g0101691 [Helianthus annuus]|nr:hypothetical protein HanPI659440_Chr03g0101691 [Helianthus annuus]
MKKVQAAKEHLAKQKADFEAYKRTEQWAVAVGHKQEIKNLKARNVTLAKEKAAAEAVTKEAETRRSAAVNELADANVGCSRLIKTIEDLMEEARKEVQAHETILGDVNRRLEEAETQARQVTEERDGLATMNAQLVDDRACIRDFGVANVANAILDAPENTIAVTNVIDRAREAGFKAGYNECLTHVNALSSKKFTDERCALRGIDNEDALRVAAEAYNNLIVPALVQ